jgi:hypothetical protein
VVASKDKRAKKPVKKIKVDDEVTTGVPIKIVEVPYKDLELPPYAAPIAVQEAWERGDYAWIAAALGVQEQLVGHYSLATLLVMAREKCGAIQK